MKKATKIARLNAYNEIHSKISIPNMHYKDDAPMFVSIVGPDSKEKSNFFNALAKHFTGREALGGGILTIKNRFRRLSLYECPGDIETTIDTVKVSDLVVLVVNLDVGLEKEVLEAINVTNAHGLTKLMAVRLHGSIKQSTSALDAIQKRISQEFSFSVRCYDFDGESVDRIVRAMEIMKTRPMEWKCMHPHIIADKYEDGWAYGYVRGGPLRRSAEVHIPGQGDRTLGDLEILADPCDSRKKNCMFYCPQDSALKEKMATAEDSSSAEPLFGDDPELKLFGGERQLEKSEEDSESNEYKGGIFEGSNETKVNCKNKENEDARIEKCNETKVDEEVATGQIPHIYKENETIEDLKKLLVGRFRARVETEEDYEARFNEEYKEDEKEELNFLQRGKLRELEIKQGLDECGELVMPGVYCRLKMDLKFEPRRILIIGSYLAGENRPIFLQGKALKNKWQKGDLKSNAPQFVSIGWHRLQTVPLFSMEGRAIKYLRSVVGARSSEVAFYGPSVPAGTGFLFFNAGARYRILGSGSVLDASGSIAIKKKLKLIGYPKDIKGNNAIIQGMFSSGKEASGFIGAKLSCASGLRGILKNSIGHGGDFRGTFEGPILLSDIVFIKCFVPVRPLEYYQHMAEGVSYVRSLQELKKAGGASLYEEKIEQSVPETSSVIAPNKDKRVKRRMASLVEQLPFSERKIATVKESLELPVSPEMKRKMEEMEMVMQLRKRKDDEDELEAARKKAKRMKKEQLEEAEKALRKRKNAVECKQALEKGGKASKRIHKKSKRKEKRTFVKK